MALRWQQPNVNQTLKSKPTPHTSPSRVSYGVSIMRILKKTDRAITAPHCILHYPTAGLAFEEHIKVVIMNPLAVIDEYLFCVPCLNMSKKLCIAGY